MYFGAAAPLISAQELQKEEAAPKPATVSQTQPQTSGRTWTPPTTTDPAVMRRAAATAQLTRVRSSSYGAELARSRRAERKSKAMNIIAHTLKYVRDGMDLDQAWAKAGGVEPLSSIAKAAGLAQKVREAEAALTPVMKGLGALVPKAGAGVVQGDPILAAFVVQELVNAGVWNKPLPTGIVPGGNAGAEDTGGNMLWWVLGVVGVGLGGWFVLRRRKKR